MRAGQEMTGIDIRYRGDRGYIVSGTVSGSSDSRMGTAVLMLSHTASGALESRTFVQPRAGRGFALYGVPDGDYELVAQMDAGTESSAASTPRHIVVKGSDVTGIEVSLAPLGSISGRAVLENIPEAERTPECKARRITSLDELLLAARRDEKSGAKDAAGLSVFAPNEGSPDEKGEFKFLSLFPGRYRIETRLPTERRGRGRTRDYHKPAYNGSNGHARRGRSRGARKGDSGRRRHALTGAASRLPGSCRTGVGRRCDKVLGSKSR